MVGSFHSGGSCDRCGCEMFLEKCDHLAPAVERLLGTIGEPRRIEEGVTCAVITMELIVLAKPLEHRLGAVDLIAVGIFIIVAEQPEQRTADPLRELDGRHRTPGVELLLVVYDHVAAPAVDGRIDIRERASGEIGMASARAEADHPDL